MENNLTIIKQPTRIESAGETDASSAEEQLARDNQPKATNGRWGGSFSSTIPFYDSQRQFRALLCLKKPPCRRQGILLDVKRICPIHAEPVQSVAVETGSQSRSTPSKPYVRQYWITLLIKVDRVDGLAYIKLKLSDNPHPPTQIDTFTLFI